ncbi:DedA family protein, partial [Pseudomonas syringae pv. actinidiae ICMP 18804]
GSAAYHFGAILEGLLGNVKKYELWVLGALILLGLGLWLRRRIKNARIAREARAEKDRFCASAAASDLDMPAAVPVDLTKKTDE